MKIVKTEFSNILSEILTFGHVCIISEMKIKKSKKSEIEIIIDFCGNV